MKKRYVVLVVTLVILAFFCMAVANTLSTKPAHPARLNTMAPAPYNP